uniref:Uncharacterized protein n=1 Tax=Meloidogyne incognita TaxID=6306 RepID=A0A914KIE2_MELIC
MATMREGEGFFKFWDWVRSISVPFLLVGGCRLDLSKFASHGESTVEFPLLIGGEIHG